MDEDEELLPEDDSVFDELANDTQLECSDALFEDSFSSVPDLQNVQTHTSTPMAPVRSSSRNRRVAVDGRSPISNGMNVRPGTPDLSSCRSGRSAESPSRPTTPVSEVSSPRRGRSAGLTSTPAVAEVSSPRRGRSAGLPATPAATEVPSPRRGRSSGSGPSSRPTTPEFSSSRRCRSRSSGAGPSSRATTSEPELCRTGRVVAVPAKKPSKQTGPRLKCPECPSTLANERTMAVHKKTHALKRAFARAAGPEEFMEKIPGLIIDAIDAILSDPLVGKWAEPLKIYSRAVKESFSDFGEEHDCLCKFLHESIYSILSNHSAIFSSSLVHTFYVGVNSLLNNKEFRIELRKYFVALDGVAVPCKEVINLFFGNIMFHLSTAVLLYFIRTIHKSTSNDEVRRKRSSDNISSRDFLEVSYYIGGSVVATFLFKAKKFGESNPSWKLFHDVLWSKFCRVEAIGNACAEGVRSWTEKRDRGGLKHISQEALDFFVVLFDFIMSMEGRDSSMPNDAVDVVLKDDTIVCLWDVLVGTSLEEEISLDFLMQMIRVCIRIVVKGIIKRKLNENIKKSIASVALRSRLAN
ncbi:Immunoglobulin A1 protease [Frankliniella fusca]|uniref:Immunoglobulin A1 protease n=1 Tax=Frankliniella fusca TaxID=407009 RepID=A0AAE1HNU5_9NEOP|nr:Immunoglobulin A1 protease [Frankliniella fusca]